MALPASDSTATRSRRSHGRNSKGARRADIQGLRTIAALLVAGYHIWSDRVSGAVDVFFVVAAFVMTLSMLRGMRSNGAVGLVRTYRNLALRMLPATLVVVIGTTAAALATTPVTAWNGLTRHAAAAAGFVLNLQLAGDSIAYLGEEASGSPVQHLWAMGVQVQLQLLLPLLGVIALFVARRTRRKPEAIVLVTTLLLGIASFVHAATSVIDQQAFAYFDPLARAWEFSAGVLAALVIGRWTAPRWMAAPAVAIGLAVLVSMGALLDLRTTLPGPMGLVPVLGAVLVLLGGTRPNAASALLGMRPLTLLADYSFGFYLWHWPVLVFVRGLLGRTELDVLSGLAVIAASAALAAATSHWVERPLRRRQQEGGSRVAQLRPFAAVTAIAAVTAASILVPRAHVQSIIDATPTDNPGAAVVVDPSLELSPFAELQPALEALEHGEWQDFQQQCEMRVGPSGGEYRRCVSGSPEAPVTLMAQGDSHTEVWLTALVPAIERGSLRVISDFVGSCPLSVSAGDKMPEDEPRWADCSALNQDRLDLILEEQPTAVITTGNIAAAGSPTIEFSDGFVEQAERIAAEGFPLIVLRDVPRRDQSSTACLLAASAPSDCDLVRENVLSFDDFRQSMPPVLLENVLVESLDMTDFLCDLELCPVAIGGVITYFDDNHLTKSYVRTMSPFFEERLAHTLAMLGVDL